MKKTSRSRGPCALFVLCLAGTLSAQGPLAPPSAPTPTMKTLDQIQPRTPLPGATSTVTIDTPGSYYLTGDIAVETGNGIVISVNNVTLDLSGFTISSSAASVGGSGILLTGARTGVHILNGHIQGTLTYDGASFSGGSFANGIFSAFNSSTCRVTGVSVVGVHTGISSFDVESCAVKTIRFNGIIWGNRGTLPRGGLRRRGHHRKRRLGLRRDWKQQPECTPGHDRHELLGVKLWQRGGNQCLRGGKLFWAKRRWIRDHRPGRAKFLRLQE